MLLQVSRGMEKQHCETPQASHHSETVNNKFPTNETKQ